MIDSSTGESSFGGEVAAQPVASGDKHSSKLEPSRSQRLPKEYKTPNTLESRDTDRSWHLENNKKTKQNKRPIFHKKEREENFPT